jgi:hypothetical protein
MENVKCAHQLDHKAFGHLLDLVVHIGSHFGDYGRTTILLVLFICNGNSVVCLQCKFVCLFVCNVNLFVCLFV